MKFNIEELENKLKNITKDSEKITKSLRNEKNKKKIEFIVFTFMTMVFYDYQIQKRDYLEFINSFSEIYLLGDKRYITFGDNYTFQDYYNEIDTDIKIKMNGFLFFMTLLYNSSS